MIPRAILLNIMVRIRSGICYWILSLILVIILIIILLWLQRELLLAEIKLYSTLFHLSIAGDFEVVCCVVVQVWCLVCDPCYAWSVPGSDRSRIAMPCHRSTNKQVPPLPATVRIWRTFANAMKACNQRLFTIRVNGEHFWVSILLIFNSRGFNWMLEGMTLLARQPQPCQTTILWPQHNSPPLCWMHV